MKTSDSLIARFSRRNSMPKPINFYYPSKIMAHCGEAVIYSLLGDGRWLPT